MTRSSGKSFSWKRLITLYLVLVASSSLLSLAIWKNQMNTDQMNILASVASLIVGFGATIMVFRVDRELEMRERDEPTWFPWADRLVIVAMMMSGLLDLALPLSVRGLQVTRIPTAAAVASVILLLGYPFAILAHYRIEIGRNRKGERDNPEPAEREIVWATMILAALMFIFALGT
jgi:hypothetical protein